jgi:hypothetical protein
VRRGSVFAGGEEKPVVEHVGGSLSEKDEQNGESV